jgi:hypothetical protein
LCLDVDQLNIILDVVGFPDGELLEEINDDARGFLQRMTNHPNRVDFYQYFPEIQAPNGLFKMKILVKKHNLNVFKSYRFD